MNVHIEHAKGVTITEGTGERSDSRVEQAYDQFKNMAGNYIAGNERSSLTENEVIELIEVIKGFYVQMDAALGR